MNRKKKNVIKTNKKVKKEKRVSNGIFKVNGKVSFIVLLKNILLPVIGGGLVGFVTRGGMGVYNSLKKPLFTPPNIMFPIVWTILYILMGIAAYRIYINNSQGKKDHNGYFYYLIQLAVNFLWSIIFFNLRLYGIAFIVIVVLLILIIITTVKFLKVDKLAGMLMIPYIIWVSYAGVLSYLIWMYNEM